MKPISLNTEKLRHLLVDIRKQQLPYSVCLADDIRGPGGGIYVKAMTPVSTRHITWFESRNPAPGRMPSFMEVVIVGADDAPIEGLPAELDAAADGAAEDARTRARNAAEAVGRQADAAARLVRGLHEQLGRNFGRTQLSSPQVIGSFQEFDREFRKLHQAVHLAVDEYLGGNSVVFDLIAEHDLERPAVRHAVRVAALATQLLVRCRTSGDDDGDPDGELVHLFLGSFLHDCGMWDEPYCFAEGHEERGAALAAAVQIDGAGPRLEKLVLFHSDLARLGTQDAASLIRLEGQELYRRVYGPETDAGEDTVDTRDRRGILALALAERWVTDLGEIQFRFRNHRDLLEEFVGYLGESTYSSYVAALCNMEVEVVAPRRAWVTLAGNVPMSTPGKRRNSRMERVDVEGYLAGSLGHDEDGASPHLITLFAPGPKGRPVALGKVNARAAALWDRATGADHRCYVAGGRFKSMLTWEVTGFLGEDEFARILGPYDRELHKRLS